MANTQTILQLGDDQLSSQFAITFPEGIPGGGSTDAITLRSDQTFDPPEDNVGTYDIVFRGMKIPKTSMTHDMTKEFNFEIRIDQNWQTHDDIVAWYKLCYDPINATALPDLMVRTTIVIQAFDGQGNVKKSYRFRGAKIKGYKVNTFDNSSTDPLRMTLNFIFADMIPE